MHLRPLEAADEAEFVRVLTESAEAWAPWTPAVKPDLDLADRFRRELNRTALGSEGGTHVRLGGFSEAGELLGFFALNEIVRGVFHSAFASWQVTASRMGMGHGTAGVRALVGLAFDTSEGGLALHRVQANIMPANGASLRIAEKIGFRREGVAQRYLRIAGVWEDHIMHAITSEEWERTPLG